MLLVLPEIPERCIMNSNVSDLKKPLVVVGIPAFNEEHSIAGIILKAQEYAKIVIVCDDGSTDLTGKIAQQLHADIITHVEKRGYGAAIKSLFCRALELKADILVTLDGDGQHDASEIPKVISPITEGSADIVIGSRFIDQKGSAEMPFYRKVGVKIITKMVNGSSKHGVSDSQSGFRAYNRQALERLCVSECGMGASVQILLEANKHYLKIEEVPSTCKYKNGGIPTSSENPVIQGFGVVSSILRFIIEERPLTFAGLPGLLLIIIGTIFGIWMLEIYAITHAIVTNIALASISFILLGLFMTSTAITLYAISRINKKLK